MLTPAGLAAKFKLQTLSFFIDQDTLRSGFPTRLGQKFFSPFGVVFVDRRHRHSLLEALANARHGKMRHEILTFENTLYHRLAVERMHQRAPHSHVIEPWIVAAQVEPTPRSRADMNLAFPGFFPLLAQNHRAVEGDRAAHAEIYFPGEHGRKVGVAVFDEADADSIDLGPSLR